MSQIAGMKADSNNFREFETLENIAPKTKEAVRRTWFALGRDLKRSANEEIKRKPKAGIEYFIRKKGGQRTRRHIASAPGETHANLSGALRRSLSWKVHGSERIEFGYGFSTTASNRDPEYAETIEDGKDSRQGTGSVEARPSLGNAIKDTQRNTENHFHREILKEFARI